MCTGDNTRYQTIKNIFSIIIALITCFNLWQLMQISIPAIASSGKNTYWSQYILFILTFIWLRHYFSRKIPFSLSACFVAILLTYLGLSGFFLEATNEETFFSIGSSFASFALLAGFSVLTYSFISLFYEKLNRLTFPQKTAFKDRTVFLLCLGTIIIGWLPFVIMNYPGSVARDTLHQLIQFSGMFPLVASFPIFDTFIYGILFNCGQRLGSDNWGVFLNVAFQTLLCAIAMARACKWIYKLSHSGKLCFVSAIFFAVIPLWGSAVQCLLKDSLHLGFFLLFIVSYIKILYWEDRKPADYITLCIHALLAAFSRKAAMAIILVSLICLAGYEIKKKKNMRKAVMPALIVGIVYFAINSLILLSPNVIPPAERENYSLPFQMVARYSYQYGHEMPQYQIDIIDSVLDFDVIRAEYTPELSDAVKNTFHSSTSEMGPFWRQFVKMGLTHPKAYLEQFLLGTYKYFYPLSPGVGTYRFYIADTVSNVSGFYDAHTVNPGWQKTISNYCKAWEQTAGLELFIGPGLYTWIVILLVGYVLKQKSLKSLISMAPIMILMVGLLFTPVNGENRYAYPLMASVPIYLCIIASQMNSTKKTVPPKFQVSCFIT